MEELEQQQFRLLLVSQGVKLLAKKPQQCLKQTAKHTAYTAASVLGSEAGLDCLSPSAILLLQIILIKKLTVFTKQRHLGATEICFVLF